MRDTDRKDGPRNIKEMLTEMKDISESIVDLGYSAVIFNSEDIAEEVRALESRMDGLLNEMRVVAIMAARSHEEAEQMATTLQVAAAAEKISNAAGDIVRLLEIDIEKRPFLPSILASADEKIRSVAIVAGSDLSGKAVGELEVESETGVRIIAIKRKKRWLYEVDSETTMKAGDYLLVRGVEDGFIRLNDIAQGVSQWK